MNKHLQRDVRVSKGEVSATLVIETKCVNQSYIAKYQSLKSTQIKGKRLNA